MWRYLLIALGISMLINLAMFVIAYRRRTDKLTDISYALSFIALAFYALVQGSLTPYRFILFAIISIWAVRLGAFLLFRIHHTGKDSRFDEMRGNFWKFGTFWASQGLVVWAVLIPALLALRYEQVELPLLAYLGLVVWLIGVLIETIADVQKFEFSRHAANKNIWISSGLWGYSRHPNYFGEITVWVGVYIFTATILTGAEALVGLVSPLLIATLLIFVSGIPILEKSANTRWGHLPAYRTYKRRTSVLVLLPPKGK